MKLPFPVLTADEAAAHISDGHTIGFSGFTPAGAAKAIPKALAARARGEHAEGRHFKVAVVTGASTISGNEADQGGGVYVSTSGGPASLANATVTGNHAVVGGGGLMLRAATQLDGLVLDGNTCEGAGGGLYLQNTTATVGDVTMNEAERGGGAQVFGGTLTVTGSIAGNTADYGGGVNVDGGGTVVFSGATVQDNTAVNTGGGLRIEEGAATGTASFSGNTPHDVYLSGSQTVVDPAPGVLSCTHTACN